MLAAVPVTYRGTRFRSTLESNWAATFDEWRWHWEYEPVALYTGDGEPYLCDFYLPSQRVWCEVKGPHDERLHKAVSLARTLRVDPAEWTVAAPIVVLLRPPGPGDRATWEPAMPEQDIVLIDCSDCQYLGFMDLAAGWQCRRCYRQQKIYSHMGGYYRSGQLQFHRAGR